MKFVFKSPKGTLAAYCNCEGSLPPLDSIGLIPDEVLMDFASHCMRELYINDASWTHTQGAWSNKNITITFDAKDLELLNSPLCNYDISDSFYEFRRVCHNGAIANYIPVQFYSQNYFELLGADFHREFLVPSATQTWSGSKHPLPCLLGTLKPQVSRYRVRIEGGYHKRWDYMSSTYTLSDFFEDLTRSDIADHPTILPISSPGWGNLVASSFVPDSANFTNLYLCYASAFDAAHASLPPDIVRCSAPADGTSLTCVFDSAKTLKMIAKIKSDAILAVAAEKKAQADAEKLAQQQADTQAKLDRAAANQALADAAAARTRQDALDRAQALADQKQAAKEAADAKKAADKLARDIETAAKTAAATAKKAADANVVLTKLKNGTSLLKQWCDLT